MPACKAAWVWIVLIILINTFASSGSWQSSRSRCLAQVCDCRWSDLSNFRIQVCDCLWSDLSDFRIIEVHCIRIQWSQHPDLNICRQPSWSPSMLVLFSGGVLQHSVPPWLPSPLLWGVVFHCLHSCFSISDLRKACYIQDAHCHKCSPKFWERIVKYRTHIATNAALKFWKRLVIYRTHIATNAALNCAKRRQRG